MKQETKRAARRIALEASGRCVCLQVRKLSRMITRDYDNALRETGLKVTQFTMLAAVVGSREGLSISELAQRLNMDRTTFSRNLAPLVRRGLVEHVDDLKGRRRGVQATDEGVELFITAAACWSRAQDLLRDRLREIDHLAFLPELAAVTDHLARAKAD